MMWIFVSSLIMTNMAHAECTPTPDCASIGYTETSCETASLKCPFDTSKLKCLPCDSSFKYDCNGDNMTGSVGSACNGKYASCECGSGYIWRGNTCEEKPNCTVGMIYYSDKSCSSNYDSSKTVAGVVVKDNELIMSPPTFMLWSSISSDTSLTNITSSSTAKADMNGKSNTAVIVSAYSGESTSENAAIYCNSYTGGISGTSGKWYLPAAGELYSYVYGNYSTINSIATMLSWDYFNDGYYFWSSSEGDAAFAWRVHPISGTLDSDNFKSNHISSVSCFFAIN